MRVISGKCRGTHLVCPEGLETRPTTDRIKETLFNIIAFDLPGCRFLDLFSGSGGIGIESLSRSAEKAVFVEKDKKALACIKQNLERTRLGNKAIVYSCDVIEALKNLKEQGEQFDIIFMDPPYAIGIIDQILEKIVACDLIAENGYIILERGTNTLVTLPQHLVLWKEKTYKTTTLSFLRKE
ncbi:16S rRNA (guanine(966)-N(2))-methyltransferase RsmD [Sporanaerobium hydrogeniformans]|uniref:16S rRNA (Guanine(966)-N(2))-methyltransferase RsmD n=1 Tax=Sporanaerobium hydrogeniformans TaxID=3072179 RepID=A0AC61DF47_9FIRM|nr:16S rRNA (guanine(966)-N(2))-methyltransferase RsmD [Sporanaerobium hydrogeniformans]PHV71814.1 16S rRNA (guanine(966)-N(2))-methyltransferase RsmD [Sporanaerobium hydrogeniformans]